LACFCFGGKGVGVLLPRASAAGFKELPPQAKSGFGLLEVARSC